MSGSYAALWSKSNYSFLEGASHPEELVQQAAKFGLRALALTDRDGVYGVVRAHLASQKAAIPVILGAEITVDTHGRSSSGISHVILLAQSRQGWGSLTRLISRGRLRSQKGSSLSRIEEVLGSAGGLTALCADPALLPSLREAFGRDLYALVDRHRLAEEIEQERKLRTAALLAEVPLIAAPEVLYHHRSRRALQDVLTCLRHGVALQNAGRHIKPNSEYALPSFEQAAWLYRDEPELLRRTLDVAERCTFSLSELDYRYPGEHIPSGENEQSWLRRLTYEGARKRYQGVVPGDVAQQLERELSLIEELSYGGYFLTMREIVEYCREQNILCQGRGSAANSAVCYCLGITAVDPVRMQLLFERFLSRERAEPPDIDLDIEHERREEVIRHVYERYGRRHAAMVANIIRYRVRSAVRDVGKVLGVPQTELDGLARLFTYWSTEMTEETMRDAGIDPDASVHQHLHHLVQQIIDFPRHLSIHPGGFLLGHEPVDTIVPIEPATMEGRTVIQWDKQDIEDLGLFKVDLLGLGCLTAIHRAFDLLRRHKGLDLEPATVPQEDPDTYKMLTKGDSVGVFQVESRAQMAMLPRLAPRTFYDLVIEVAIVRPGPIQGDMVHPYLRRRSGKEPVEFPHPDLEQVLKRTLGVPIFQEQVMKLAMLAADYTPGEADQLRRDMAAWRSKGRIEQHRDRIIQRMKEKGIPDAFAERVFAQIRGFGEYGFPESHAASFALLAYITAWIKCHHPATFTCAMLNAQPMGFYAPSTLVEDVKRHGIQVLPIDVQHSEWDSSLEQIDGKWCIRMGFRLLDGFGVREQERLFVGAQLAGGPPGDRYPSIEQFVKSTRLSQRALVRLAEAGAFSSFGLKRRDAIWRVRALVHYASDSLPLEPAQSQASFMGLSRPEAIAWDYRSGHHSALGHPMLALRKSLQQQRLPAAEDLNQLRHGQHTRYVGVVICRQRPQTATGVTFMTLEDETGFVNLVLWRDVFDRNAFLAKTAALLGVQGQVQKAEGVTHLIAKTLFPPDFEMEQTPNSRDFH